MIDRLGGFAARIAARHAHAVGPASPVGRALRRTGGLSLVVLRTGAMRAAARIVRPELTLRVQPHFAFNTQVTNGAAVAHRAAAILGSRAMPRREPQVAVPRDPAPPRMRAFLAITASRPIELVTRREGVVAKAIGSVTPAGQAPPPAPVGHTMARPMPATPTARREIAVAPLARSMTRAAGNPLAAAVQRIETTVERLASQPPRELPPPARTGAFALPDTSLIADQVLRTLDHRVIAMRERMGRR